MTIQIIKLNLPNIFKRYMEKYDIFRDLYEVDLLGLEIRNIEDSLSENLKSIILGNQEICYSYRENDRTDFLAIGTISIFKELSKKVVSSGNEDAGYKLLKTIRNYTEYNDHKIDIAGKIFDMSTAHVMGILNVTPDSFSDGGNYFSTKEAITHGIELIEAGAEIIDIGGESSRPGSEPVTAEEEKKRVLPVIRGLLAAYPDAIISLDTTKSEVAYEALKEGVKIINDISGLADDPGMLNTIREFDAALVLMHMKGVPGTMQDNPAYNDVVNEVYDFLKTQSGVATNAGIKNIIIDPGIGFGKRVVDNYEIINRLEEFKSLGFPILIGLSRKSFIGKVFNKKVEEREDLTLTSETISIINGARFVRTHNIKNTLEAVKLIELIQNTDRLPNV